MHGGEIAAARRMFAEAPEPFIDLSTGINPYSYPLPQLSPELFERLPDPQTLGALAAIAAQAYGAPSAAHVVPAPGTQILLPLAAGLIGPARAAVVAPTYGEHVRAAGLAGHRVTEIADLDAVHETMLVFVTNPNNPDGRLFDKNDLIALAKRLEARGGLLVVDEAFMDVGPPDAGLASEVGRNRIVVLRSFGKFFGLGGLRLGFALAAPPLAARLAAKVGPWADSTPFFHMLDLRSSVELRCSGWRAQVSHTICSFILVAPESWSASSSNSRPGCASVCRLPRRPGPGCRLQWLTMPTAVRFAPMTFAP